MLYQESVKRDYEGLSITKLALVIPDLLCSAPTGGVCNGPSCLLPCFELGLGLNLDEDREYVGVNHGLDLLSVARGDVRYCPTSLLR